MIKLLMLALVLCLASCDTQDVVASNDKKPKPSPVQIEWTTKLRGWNYLTKFIDPTNGVTCYVLYNDGKGIWCMEPKK